MEQARQESQDDRPRYRRGSGLKVVICHKDHPDAKYYVRWNEGSGNKVLEDPKGFLYALVCQYDMIYRS